MAGPLRSAFNKSPVKCCKCNKDRFIPHCTVSRAKSLDQSGMERNGDGQTSQVLSATFCVTALERFTGICSLNPGAFPGGRRRRNTRFCQSARCRLRLGCACVVLGCFRPPRGIARERISDYSAKHSRTMVSEYELGAFDGNASAVGDAHGGWLFFSEPKTIEDK